MAKKKKYGFYRQLNNLFSTNVIVRRVEGGHRVVDTQRLQAAGNFNNSRYVDRFNRLHKTRGSGNQKTNAMNSYAVARPVLYNDYEAMDMDPIIAPALDIYADETTMPGANEQLIEVVTEDHNIEKLLNNLFNDILNVDFNLWLWVRSLCKYGDFFLYLDILPKIGIVNVQPMSVYDVEREEGFDEDNPYKVRFVKGVETTMYGYSNYTTTQRKSGTVLQSYEVAHFRLLTDSNFLPYGRSMIEPARMLFKQMKLMEDAMLIHRIMRSPEKRIFKIDVGNIPANEVDGYMQKVIDQSKKVPFTDPDTGNYNLKFNMQNILEDFYVPVRGGQSGTEIDTTPGLSYDGIQDVEYLLAKLFAALKIPKAFLGYEGDVNAKATLAAEDVRFARTIDRIQRTVISELEKIAIIHLFAQGVEDAALVNFELKMHSPSTIYEQEKIAILQAQVDLARDIKDSGVRSMDFVLRNVFNLSNDEVEQENAQMKIDAKDRYIINTLESDGTLQEEEPEEEETTEEASDLPKGGSREGGNEGAGRPKRGIKYRSTRHVRGGDANGAVEYNKNKHSSIEKSYESIIQDLQSKFQTTTKTKKDRPLLG